jgi:drug/metabolite transporter (DMT)-like permease
MDILLYAAIVAASVTQSASGKAFNRGGGSALTFNLLKTLSALILFLVIRLPQFCFHLPTLLYGLSYGLSLCMSMYAGYRALCLGPMALTSMLASFSLLIPFGWGIGVRGEPVQLTKGVGLVLLLAAMLLVNAHHFRAGRKDAPSRGESSSPSWQWPLFVAITFLCNGICSVLQTEHQAAYPGLYNREFMLFAMLICALVYTVVALARLPMAELRAAPRKGLGILAGVTNSLASYFTLMLAGMENASILFPIVSAGNILGALLCGRFIFKERLRVNQYAALALGILAIVLMKL